MKSLSALCCYCWLGLFGCGGSRTDPPDLPQPPNSVSGPLEQIAYYGSWVGGLLVMAGILMFWFRPTQAPRVIFVALSILTGAQAMLWISAHLGLITVAMLLFGALYLAYKKRDDIGDASDHDTTVVCPTPFTDAAGEVPFSDDDALEERTNSYLKNYHRPA